MTLSNLPITPFDVRHASEAEYARVNDLQNVLRAEQMPDDPPMPLREAMAMWRNMPAVVDARNWIVWHGQSAVARAEVEMMQTNDNRHLAYMYIQVLPAYRRQGLARQLLKLIAEAAQSDGRRLLDTFTAGNVPSGEVFMRALGATLGIARHRNQLLIAELNRELMRQWLTRAPERAAGFELDVWIGPYPEAHIHAVVALNDAMNGEPRDGLDIEDVHKSPAEIRAWERQTFGRGTERWCMVARETATGVTAGYSEVFWNPNRPEILNQGATGVLPAYRNKGLARWLKAAMLDKVLRDRLQVTRIRTGNADSNAPMLKINFELGFRHYISESVWQIEVAQVEKYLADSR